MGGARRSVVVIGGGVVGLSIALRLADADVDCTLVDPSPGRGTSWAAGGMLSPAAEVAPGEQALLGDLRAAAVLWPSFARRVSEASGVDVGYSATGSILVGYNASDAREASRLAGLIASAGVEVVALSSLELASTEPMLAANGQGGWLLPGDHRVDNRLLLEALVAALKSLGVRIVEDRCVTVDRRAAALRCELEHQGDLLADGVVLAVGSTPAPAGLEELGLPRVRPVRGVTLRLALTPGVQVPARTVRGVVDGTQCYLVPREDGSLVVGATSEEQGYAEIARAGGVHQLLDAARRLFPALDELAFEEVAVGLRPATEDHQPFVSRLADERLVAALGHYRNGLLLAPLTAARVLELVRSR